MIQARLGKALAFTLAGLFLSGCRAAPLPPTGEAEPKGVRAMWVWDARVAADGTARDRLLKFCRRHRVDTLYLSAYDLRPPMEERYRQFNRLAHQQGITVHALAGDPRWGKPQYHHVPLEWVASFRRFNEGASEPERFNGLHTDVEVYLLSKSWKEQPAMLLGGYLDLNAKIAGELAQDPAEFSVDIPFWFDDDPNYRIFWHGSVKAPAQHVLDTVDSVTVMAYRNFAEGQDGTVHLVSVEMSYADLIGKQVVIGQETQENLYPPYITFGGTSCNALYKEMDKIEGVLGKRPSFGGFALHHYDSYRKLCGE
ncbi:MAG: hypothetical protein Q7J69_00515 [Candidatus Omnitrophota bacterium]|nr:hypothetical protein [Candidatus Omnitrophota bacterium]